MADKKESNPYDLDSLSIADLRKLAAVMKITHQKDWTTEDFHEAINARRKHAKVARLVHDENDPIPTGFARIKMHLTPSGSDSPLDARVNMFYTMIPRDVLVDVPREIRDIIRNSTEVVTREVTDKETGHRVVKTFEVQCYSFDQYGESMGDSGAIKGINDPREQSLRVKYRDIYGRWPRRQSDQWKNFEASFVEAANRKLVEKALSDESKTVG